MIEEIDLLKTEEYWTWFTSWTRYSAVASVPLEHLLILKWKRNDFQFFFQTFKCTKLFSFDNLFFHAMSSVGGTSLCRLGEKKMLHQEKYWGKTAHEWCQGHIGDAPPAFICVDGARPFLLIDSMIFKWRRYWRRNQAKLIFSHCKEQISSWETKKKESSHISYFFQKGCFPNSTKTYLSLRMQCDKRNLFFFLIIRLIIAWECR